MEFAVMSKPTKTLDEALEFFVNNLITPKWDTLLELLADDAVVEFPFAPPNRPEKLTGKREIVSYFDLLKKRVRLDEVHLIAAHKTTDPNVIILQAEGKGQTIPDGRPFEPKYIDILTFRDGLIVRLQDYWNPLIGILAFGGTISLPNAEA
jgi:uncharacterized protein